MAKLAWNKINQGANTMTTYTMVSVWIVSLYGIHLYVFVRFPIMSHSQNILFNLQYETIPQQMPPPHPCLPHLLLNYTIVFFIIDEHELPQPVF